MNTSLQGRIEDFRLSSILTLLELEHQTGLLMVTNFRTRHSGTLFVREGRVVRATIDGRRHPVESEAVLTMLSWSSGAFEFLASEVQLTDEVRSSTTTLILEAARRLDETTRH